MTRKKFVKHLMAGGTSRNDANAVADFYVKHFKNFNYSNVSKIIALIGKGAITRSYEVRHEYSRKETPDNAGTAYIRCGRL